MTFAPRRLFGKLAAERRDESQMAFEPGTTPVTFIKVTERALAFYRDTLGSSTAAPTISATSSI